MRQPRAVGASLWAWFVASAAVYAAIAWLGPRYALDVAVADRPLLTVLGLYVLASCIYFAALRSVLRTASSGRLGWWILGTSAVFRVTLLPTPPYQEIDIYRYLWDGAVVSIGEDPYAYPPQRIVGGLADPGTVKNDTRLAKLVKAAADLPPLAEIVREIHYAELPTPYPPVSQAVFAGAATTSGADWSAMGRLIWLKAWLVAFDLATLLLVMDLLRLTNMPIGWALAYGWCPLVLKEIAGSGHLDAIATFFVVASLALGIRALSSRSLGSSLGSSALLALGVGAKLFPIILAPALAVGLWRRCGAKATLVATLVFLSVTGLALAPMFWPAAVPSGPPVIAEGVQSLPPPPGLAAPAAGVGKTDGIAAFFSQWEMNDLLFMIAFENLRSQAGTPRERSPWFDVTPEVWSGWLAGQDAWAFKATRAATLLVFSFIALPLAWRAAAGLDGSAESCRGWLRVAFLTLAWFWLLAPTQNPWYWCWAVPLLPWAGGRAWLAMSAASFAYYLRFVLESRFADPPLLGTPYGGEHLFYFVVPWVEFAPILVWLALEWSWAGRRRTVSSRTDKPSTSY